jgi:ABC-type transporter Mla subunit MlaD
MTPKQQKHLNFGLAVAVALVVLIIVVVVAARGRKRDSFEPMSAARMQTSDDAGLQAMPADLNGA